MTQHVGSAVSLAVPIAAFSGVSGLVPPCGELPARSRKPPSCAPLVRFAEGLVAGWDFYISPGLIAIQSTRLAKNVFAIDQQPVCNRTCSPKQKPQVSPNGRPDAWDPVITEFKVVS